MTVALRGKGTGIPGSGGEGGKHTVVVKYQHCMICKGGVRCGIVGVRSGIVGVRCGIAGVRCEIVEVRCGIAGVRCGTVG